MFAEYCICLDIILRDRKYQFMLSMWILRKFHLTGDTF